MNTQVDAVLNELDFDVVMWVRLGCASHACPFALHYSFGVFTLVTPSSFLDVNFNIFDGVKEWSELFFMPTKWVSS